MSPFLQNVIIVLINSLEILEILILPLSFQARLFDPKSQKYQSFKLITQLLNKNISLKININNSMNKSAITDIIILCFFLLFYKLFFC